MSTTTDTRLAALARTLTPDERLVRLERELEALRMVLEQVVANTTAGHERALLLHLLSEQLDAQAER